MVVVLSIRKADWVCTLAYKELNDGTYRLKSTLLLERGSALKLGLFVFGTLVLGLVALTPLLVLNSLTVLHKPVFENL